VFKGRYDHAVDGKGRASLPARFREAIAGLADDRIVLTYSLDSEHPHLDVYPITGWRQFEEKLAAKPMFDPGVTVLKRLYVANAVECPLDGHGRILIPPQHREFARIGKDVVWLGMNRIVELWQPDEWRKAEAEAMGRIEEVRRHLAGFDL
jgi:MraZ protein